MKSNKIFIEDWLKNKPYNNHNSIDIEYLTISNKIYKKFDEYFSIFDTLDVTRQEMKDLAVFLSAYLEDLVSDTQIWNAFISIHKREYKKPLPFYEESNYTDEEVNKIDIQFLIWYYFNITNPERFLSPYDEYLNVLAGEVFEILNNEYEYVSENEILKQHYLLKPNSDFYETRSTIQKILFESYLFGIDSKTKLNEKIIDSFSEKNQLEKNEQLRLINSITDSHTHSYRTKLLAYKGKDWLSEIIGKEHNLFNSVKNISDKISSWFLYKGQTTTHIHFKHIASDIIFDLTKESFNANFELTDNHIYYIEMILWNNEWTFSGITLRKDFDANLILDEKNDMLKINLGTQFDKQIQIETKIALQKQEEIFIDIYKSPIIFIDAKDVKVTLEHFMNYHNNSLSKNEAEANRKLEETKQIQKEKGYFGEDPNLDIVEEGNYVIYYNPNSGIEMFNNICNIFPDKNNPFYKGENVNEIKMFLFSPIYSKELTEYYIEKYADKCGFFKTGTGKKYLHDFDFLLRFWKNENYYTKPSITLI